MKTKKDIIYALYAMEISQRLCNWWPLWPFLSKAGSMGRTVNVSKVNFDSLSREKKSEILYLSRILCVLRAESDLVS